MWKLLKSRVPFNFILFVIGLVLHFFFTIDVVYADSTDNINNSTVLQQSETEQTVNKVGARKTMNSGVSVQVVATADDLQSAVQRLPAFNRWKEAIFQGVLTTGILTATSSVQGDPKAKNCNFCGTF